MRDYTNRYLPWTLQKGNTGAILHSYTRLIDVVPNTVSETSLLNYDTIKNICKHTQIHMTSNKCCITLLAWVHALVLGPVPRGTRWVVRVPGLSLSCTYGGMILRDRDMVIVFIPIIADRYISRPWHNVMDTGDLLFARDVLPVNELCLFSLSVAGNIRPIYLC